MTADNQGHFYVTGSVNGATVRFLVDTGATMVSLGASDARRIGLDFNRGQKGMTQTANGQSVVSKVQLDTVRIGDVTSVSYTHLDVYKRQASITWPSSSTSSSVSSTSSTSSS